MTDILERLRAPVGEQMEDEDIIYLLRDRVTEAADEIERLRAALGNDEFDADLCAENDNLTSDNERLRASELAWKLMAEKNDEWNALPQSEKEAALRKALDDEVGDGIKKDDEIERLRAQNHDLRGAMTAYLKYLRISVNVGPLTDNPTKEAALLRNMRDLISAPGVEK